MHLTHKFLPSSILWVLILLFVRETKSKTLEELDQVFAIPTEVHAAYGLRQIPYGVRKWILRQEVPDDEVPDLFEMALKNQAVVHSDVEPSGADLASVASESN
jgi:hypothetical protein